MKKIKAALVKMSKSGVLSGEGNLELNLQRKI